MIENRNCYFCKYYKDEYCENLELKPCYPQKGCEDFSRRMTRKEAIDIIKCLAWHTRPDEEDVEQAIKALEQEPKTGHWIRQKSPYGEAHTYECSKCGRTIYAEDDDLLDFPYCHCGARMVEPQESEDR